MTQNQQANTNKQFQSQSYRNTLKGTGSKLKLDKPPDEFDIEYAKLISKQFPIADEHGTTIDYSNINEYQLELLALHEEYGEETDFSKRRKIFEKL